MTNSNAAKQLPAIDISNYKEPGIYSDITNAEYHNGPGLSKSGVAMILQSPAHYWAKYLDPERERFEETEAMRIGSAAHKLLLEPDDFKQEFEVLSEATSNLNKNTKAYKEAVAKVRESGRLPLLADQYKDIEKLVSNIRNHPTAGRLVVGGKAEQSFYWIDPDTGVLCKCRPDYWVAGLALPDLKTTNDARRDEFARSVAKFTYYIQDPFYSDGVAQLTGEALPMPFIAVEKESPFALGVYTIDEADINYGRTQYKKALELYARCVETDYWPAYPPEIQMISLPKWARK